MLIGVQDNQLNGLMQIVKSSVWFPHERHVMQAFGVHQQRCGYPVQVEPGRVFYPLLQPRAEWLRANYRAVFLSETFGPDHELKIGEHHAIGYRRGFDWQRALG